MVKLYEDHKHVYKYLKKAVIHDDIELEVIFGMNPFKNPLNKSIFMKVLNSCKEYYKVIGEKVSLDIRTQYGDNKLSNVRCTIHGLDEIKKYCKTDEIIDINDIEFIQKSYYRDMNEPRFKYFPLKEENYNVRMNIKKEIVLEHSNYKVTSLKTDFKNKKKHFRYKKRFSFKTHDELFRIDLSVIKSTKQVDRKFVLNKSFRDSNILNNLEEYELEIEYIGHEEDKQINISKIEKLYEEINDRNLIIKPGVVSAGNIYDPLNIGMTFTEDIYSKEKETVEYDYNYDSPRYEESKTDYVDYNISSIKYSQDEYRTLLGKGVKIKDEYFTENDIDPKVKEALNKYYSRGYILTTIQGIYEEINIESGEYVGTKVNVSVFPSIGTYSSFMVPLDQLYGGNYTITEDKIVEGITGEKEEKKEVVFDKRNEQILGELCKELLKIIETNVFFLTKIIYNIDVILPLKVKSDVIEEYKMLTQQKSKYFTFMGPQPVTLMKDNISLNNKGSILLNYAVTEKADGERYELFIYKKKGYLINSKMNVIDTGVIFNGISGNWILDGEFITRDKYNNDIKLFMIFDVYWAGGWSPEPAYTYPFVGDDISRSSLLQKFSSELSNLEYSQELIDSGGLIIKFGIKEYHFGYLTDDEVDPKKMKEKDIMKIFESSKKILEKDKDDVFQYRIDGLIYLPVNLPVKGELEGSPPKLINGTWNYNYKWKPPEENTIDFLVKVKKELVKSVLKDKVLPFVDENILQEYKQLELYVGYDIKKDESINFCMDILDFKEISDEEKSKTLEKFSVDEFNQTNLILTDGKMLCLNFDKDEIKDGDIVEMRFNGDAIQGMNWEPLRVRTDKIKPQFFTVADNVWETIQNPVTNEMIQGGYKDFKSIEEVQDKGEYYISNENEEGLTESYPLRKLHNFIKSKLITGVCSSFDGKIKVLDLSIGRGGDIKKFHSEDSNISFLMGLDISSNYKEACKRFYYERSPKPLAVFLRGDTSKNIMNGECCSFDNQEEYDRNHCDTMLSIIYDKSKSFTKEYKNIQKRYKGIAKGGFDVVSSQFSMHYYFKTEQTFNGFLQNLLDNVKVGGYFIGTCYNGMKIFKHFHDIYMKEELWRKENLSSDDSYEEKPYEKSLSYVDPTGNLVYRIEKKYEIKDFNYNPEDLTNMFGIEIDVYMDSIGQTFTEYLVNFDFFKNVMSENGFEVTVIKDMPRKYSNIFRADYLEDGLGSFENVIQKIPEIKESDKEFQKYYSEAFEVYRNSLLEKLSSFNNYFIFQRTQ